MISFHYFSYSEITVLSLYVCDIAKILENKIGGIESRPNMNMNEIYGYTEQMYMGACDTDTDTDTDTHSIDIPKALDTLTQLIREANMLLASRVSERRAFMLRKIEVKIMMILLSIKAGNKTWSIFTKLVEYKTSQRLINPMEWLKAMQSFLMDQEIGKTKRKYYGNHVKVLSAAPREFTWTM